MVGLWRVKPMVVHSGGPDSDSDLCFVVGSGDKDFTNDLPTWVNPIDMDSFDAVPTKVISPINLWLRNGKIKAIHHGVVYLKIDEPLPLMTLAAQKCFYSLAKHHLKTLCDEMDLVPTTPDLLGHLEILIQTILPDLTPADVNEILQLRCEIKEDPLSEFLQNPEVADAMFPEEDQKALQDSEILNTTMFCVLLFFVAVHI